MNEGKPISGKVVIVGLLGFFAILAIPAVLWWASCARSLRDNDPPLSVVDGLPESIPLTRAIQDDNVADVRKLLDSGVKADSVLRDEDGDASTALELAAAKGNVEIVRLLLDHGATADLIDDWGGTAATAAAQAGRPEALALLLQRKAGVGQMDGTRKLVQEKLRIASGDEAERFRKVAKLLGPN